MTFSEYFLAAYVLSVVILSGYYIITRAEIIESGDDMSKEDDIIAGVVIFMPVINVIATVVISTWHAQLEAKLFLRKRQVDYDAWIIRQHAKVDVRMINGYGMAWFIKQKETQLEEYRAILKEYQDGVTK